MARAAVFQNMELKDDWDIVSADNDDSSMYSISDGEQGHTLQNIGAMVNDSPITEESLFMMWQDSDETEAHYLLRPQKETPKRKRWRDDMV